MNSLMRWPVFDRVFDDIWNYPFDEFNVDRIDTSEKDGVLTVKMNLPGYEPSQVRVLVEERNLRVAADNGNTKFARNYTLPYDVDAVNASAELKLGVLYIKLPRASKAIKIEVK
jgi:HSP20 family molecular chaperone IbpA